MPAIPSRFARAALAASVAAALAGCASTELVRGELVYDLRPKDDRAEVVLPPPPDAPRFRYVGELIGQRNFDDPTGAVRDQAVSFLKWVVGLFDGNVELRLQRPLHGATDSDGRVYVVDGGLNAVVVFDPHPPEDEKSKEPVGHMQVWRQAGAEQNFDGPVAVAITWDGEIAVSDSRLGAVVRLDDRGRPLGRIGEGVLQRPTGLAFDRAANLLYIADTVANEIKVFDRQGRLVRRFGEAGAGAEQLNAPTHLAFRDGRLYVSDTLNARVQVYDPSGRRVGTVGERGLYVGNFTRPKGVAVSRAGHVYVVESYYGHLLAFDAQSRLLLGMAGSGRRSDTFRLPAGVWTDEHDRVFVADLLNGRVVVLQFLGGG
jgi:DNA-binding beta-propeller fold protein YncE